MIFCIFENSRALELGLSWDEILKRRRIVLVARHIHPSYRWGEIIQISHMHFIAVDWDCFFIFRFESLLVFFSTILEGRSWGRADTFLSCGMSYLFPLEGTVNIERDEEGFRISLMPVRGHSLKKGRTLGCGESQRRAHFWSLLVYEGTFIISKFTVPTVIREVAQLRYEKTIKEGNAVKQGRAHYCWRYTPVVRPRLMLQCCWRRFALLMVIYRSSSSLLGTYLAIHHHYCGCPCSFRA